MLRGRSYSGHLPHLHPIPLADEGTLHLFPGHFTFLRTAISHQTNIFLTLQGTALRLLNAQKNLLISLVCTGCTCPTPLPVSPGVKINKDHPSKNKKKLLDRVVTAREDSHHLLNVADSNAGQGVGKFYDEKRKDFRLAWGCQRQASKSVVSNLLAKRAHLAYFSHAKLDNGRKLG